MRHLLRFFAVSLIAAIPCVAQQANPPKSRVEKTTNVHKPSTSQASTEPTAEAAESKAVQQAPQASRPEAAHPETAGAAQGATENIKYDMTEVPPVVTHHQITVNGKVLHYTATVGRMPIRTEEGKTEALMFYVAYTLDGAEPGTRPLTFAFNGGPGSASLWLHMGALGPRKVVLQPAGWMPAAPYHLEDNPYTPLDRTDLVLVDAIGTGFSRPADINTGKKFWGVKGDIQAFGEFIRMFITRNERWSSPLYLFGESYGTTRSAGLSGYLAEKGISLNGIVLLSTILQFSTVETTRGNDQAYIYTFPTYTMIAAYHKKLAPDLLQDVAKTRAEVEKWAVTDYAAALAKGDAIPPQERDAIATQIARYSGLSKQDVLEANLRIDVRWFTHRLLADQQLRVGRLDGRYTGPDPEGYLETRFYDPTSSATSPPFTAMYNDYVRRELGYKTDMPYQVLSMEVNRNWSWGSQELGFPDTSGDLRSAMVKNPFLKVLVMEGYYDLATPYFAVNDTMDHLDLPERYRNNISYATYESGHMVYLNTPALEKMKNDFAGFIENTTQH